MRTYVNIDEKSVYAQLYHLKQVVFEVTDSCNLNCKYCGYGDMYTGYDARKGQNLSFRDAKAIIDYLLELWDKSKQTSLDEFVAISFYGGEPLINMKLIKDIVLYLESLKHTPRFFRYSMTTNAILLDRYMDYLAEKKIHLLISLDGDSEAQSYRVDHNGKNSFNKVFDNVKKIESKYPDYFNECVNFNSVLHDRNTAYSISKFIKDSFGKNPRIAPLNSTGLSKDKFEEFANMYNETTQSIKTIEELEYLITTDQELQVPIVNRLMHDIFRNSGNYFSDYNSLLYAPSNIQYSTGTCIPFSKKMFITTNGKILTCEKIDHKFAVGNVKDGIVNIDVPYAVKLQNSLYAKLEKQCSICQRRADCMQCVYQIDEIDNEKPTCNSYFSKKEKDKRTTEYKMFLSKYPFLYKKIMEDVTLI